MVKTFTGGGVSQRTAIILFQHSAVIKRWKCTSKICKFWIFLGFLHFYFQPYYSKFKDIWERIKLFESLNHDHCFTAVNICITKSTLSAIKRQ